MDNENKDDNLTQIHKKNILVNIQSVLLYALSVIVALGLNDIVTNIFDSFPDTQHIVSKTIYVVIMFGFTIMTAYYLGDVVNG